MPLFLGEGASRQVVQLILPTEHEQHAHTRVPGYTTVEWAAKAEEEEKVKE